MALDPSQASDFLVNQAENLARDVASSGPELLRQAHDLNVVHNGRLPSPLPSPPPPATLQPSKRLQDFAQEFSNGIQEFLRKSKDEDAANAYKGSCWDDLRKEAGEAWQAYENQKDRRRSWRHPFEVLDNVGENAACRLEFLLELVPDSTYSSLLSGSLTLAYNTAKRKREVRGQILELFDGLSGRILHTKAKIKLYSHDVELRDSSEKLYMATLDCVRHCTVWLNKSSALESFKAFFQQSRYGSKLEDAMDNIKKKSSDFEETIEVCFMRRVENIQTSVEWMKQPIAAMYFLLNEFVKDFPAQLAKMAQEARQNANPTIQYVQAPAVQPTVSALQLRQLLSMNWRSSNPVPAQDTGMPFEDDANTALRHVLAQSNQEQMGLLMSDVRFTTWLKLPSSQFIIVHDEKSLHSMSALSTLSYLCGLMSKTLRNPGMWPLSFFCGLHSTAGTSLQGGKGIIRGLTLQLLMAFGDAIVPTAFDPSIIAQRLAMDDLEAICSVFSILLGNLPVGMVYCLIDGVHWCDTEAWSDDTKAVMRFLNGLVTQLQAVGKGLVLKVLVTNPGLRQRYSWGLQAEDVYLEQGLLTSGHRGIEAEMITSASRGFQAF